MKFCSLKQVTWDPAYYSGKNSTIIIQADYVNKSQEALGTKPFSSPETKTGWGFVPMLVEKSWLQGYSSNNLTLYIMNLDNTVDQSATSLQGPNITVTNKPVNYYHPDKTKTPSGQSLYIALPTVFGFILVVLVGGFFLNRKHRQIGLGNVMGRRKGYGVGKSKRSRLGLGKSRAGAIKLRNQELTSEGEYHDAPALTDRDVEQNLSAHRRRDSDGLGSLVGTPTDERANYFRDEMRRQEAERRS